MLCCPQLFGRTQHIVLESQGLCPWQLLEPPCPCPVQGLEEAAGSKVDTWMLLCSVWQPYGCCPELLSPLPRWTLELCLHCEVLPSRPCPAHRGHHQVRTMGLLPREPQTAGGCISLLPEDPQPALEGTRFLLGEPQPVPLPHSDCVPLLQILPVPAAPC